MLNNIHKRRLEGSPMFILTEKNFPETFKAVKTFWSVISSPTANELVEVRVRLNKMYLERLEEFLKDMIGPHDVMAFIFQKKGSCDFEKMVAYPLANKAFQFILEEMRLETITKEVHHETVFPLTPPDSLPMCRSTFFDESHVAAIAGE